MFVIFEIERTKVKIFKIFFLKCKNNYLLSNKFQILPMRLPVTYSYRNQILAHNEPN
ncbi:hypothetical protein AAJ76_340000702 [Vairimorpha ceranae]|uniref:Uncharacterized protein n=1 Tax=Vairimorpha ceranae TaxID=40302 RepID=A0A0F9W9I8_9MICR|nr:hypothetical protein AAJ76_340000702 [Vairimorpha ceranae]KKO73655.1 hypothetical protein AAJ76_340000702 [Vairimorpha ceranae]